MRRRLRKLWHQSYAVGAAGYRLRPRQPSRAISASPPRVRPHRRRPLRRPQPAPRPHRRPQPLGHQLRALHRGAAQPARPATPHARARRRRRQLGRQTRPPTSASSPSTTSTCSPSATPTRRSPPSTAPPSSPRPTSSTAKASSAASSSPPRTGPAPRSSTTSAGSRKGLTRINTDRSTVRMNRSFNPCQSVVALVCSLVLLVSDSVPSVIRFFLPLLKSTYDPAGCPLPLRRPAQRTSSARALQSPRRLRCSPHGVR